MAEERCSVDDLLSAQKQISQTGRVRGTTPCICDGCDEVSQQRARQCPSRWVTVQQWPHVMHRGCPKASCENGTTPHISINVRKIDHEQANAMPRHRVTVLIHPRWAIKPAFCAWRPCAKQKRIKRTQPAPRCGGSLPPRTSCACSLRYTAIVAARAFSTDERDHYSTRRHEITQITRCTHHHSCSQYWPAGRWRTCVHQRLESI